MLLLDPELFDNEEKKSVDKRDELIDAQRESLNKDGDKPMDELSDNKGGSESLHNKNEVAEGVLDNRMFDRLREYARFHWMLHVRSCEGGNTEQLSTLLKRFLGRPPTWYCIPKLV
jgi:hypothetical protein